MAMLTRKLRRDLRRLWPQALAIAFVMAAGVATLILATGAYASLSETRSAYYERNRFADLFASVTRAPNGLAQRIAEIPGVAAVETRIAKLAPLDIAGMREPASAMFVSLPDIGEQRLNTLYMRSGRLPIPGDDREVVVNASFADAHGFGLGDRFAALLNGTKRQLTIVGIGLSPEYIFTLGPGELVPDDRRFGVVWMSEKALAAAFDLDGAFSDVAVTLMRDVSEQTVIDELDVLLKRYGSEGAYGRKDHLSHAFLDAELKQLQAMARILPPIFLVVAAFLVNMTLSRLVALEREQIGLLKAIGYSNVAVGMHYLQFVAVIALAGIAIGAAGGTWLGVGLTRLYQDFYHFPFLVFDKDPAMYITGAVVTLFAALAGAIRAVAGVVGLSPAVAMSPPAPGRYRRLFELPRMIAALLPTTIVMVSRNLVHWPIRTGSTILGMALGVSILVASLWTIPSIDLMIDVTFYRADRQSASISFAETKRLSAAFDVARLPGVSTVEPYRTLAVRLRHGHVSRRVAITGKPIDADLSRVLDIDFDPVRLPETGIVLSDMLARILDARVGDLVEADILQGERRTVEVPVTAIVQGYMGLTSYMNLDALNRLAREGALVSGVHLSYDAAEEDALFKEIEDIPAANFIALQKVSLQKFRETLADNILIMITVYVVLAGVIAFGVVYNAARISLSERARELASLRVLGFTRAEVSAILLGELGLLTLLAQPLGWLIGYLFAKAMAVSFETELYRMPFLVEASTFAESSLVVLAAAAISALVVRRRIDRLDLIEVLKTRE
ncbi:MAG TPA: FtsX-like permease family protein [Hyphomicrobiales bacterium]|nr:FtsX-like permease family protein [Hyphomicrobiales bacterium]